MKIDDNMMIEAVRMSPVTYAHEATMGEYQTYRHLFFMQRKILEAYHKGRGRLIINLPPQHGKSWLVSFWMIICLLEQDPTLRIILTTYAAELAASHGRKVRNEIRSNPYVRVKLSEDSTSGHRWDTDHGGGMYCVGVEGSVSGFSGDLIIVDDPHKDWAEAHSHRKRRAVHDWFNSTLYTRRQQNTTIIIVQTRWHEDDLTGHLLREHPDDWTVISLPAIALENDPLGRAVGEPLCPEMHDIDDLESSMNSNAVWESLYQQNPQGMGTANVYSHFSHNANVNTDLKPVPELELDISVDYNIRPGMHIIIGQYDGKRDMLYAYDEIYRPGMSVIDAARAFAEWWRNHDGDIHWPRINVYDDPAGRARSIATGESLRHTLANVLTAEGIRTRFLTGNQSPPMRDSIDAVNQTLYDIRGQHHYEIHPKCKRLLADYMELQSDEDGLIDKSDQALSHASDAERYRIARLRPVQRMRTGQTRKVIIRS